MQVPSAAVTTESHALSRYKSFQSVLFFEYLINQLLPQRVFQQHRSSEQLDWTHPVSQWGRHLSELAIEGFALMKIRYAVAASVPLFALLSCAKTTAPTQTVSPEVKTAEASIDPEKIRAH